MANNDFGGVDILFNNAGVLDDKMWETAVDTNIVRPTSYFWS